MKLILYHDLLQYDFPKQEAVIQFVIEAIQAESFNPKTLFLIGSYTIGKFSLPLSPLPKLSISLSLNPYLYLSLHPTCHLSFLVHHYYFLAKGKERLFLEVARLLHRKVHVTAAKFRLLECLGFSKEDMQWFTLNEQESQIHVVPMWTLASFKRLKHISNQYAVSRFFMLVLNNRISKLPFNLTLMLK